MLRPLLALSLLLVPAAALAGDAVERRLHPDRVEASSFLWNDWNKFQENYHPSYVGDDDPKTAWVEGAQNSGAGEWIKIAVTELDGTTRVRLRVRAGYQKSGSLFKANARPREVEVRLLPGGAKKKATLVDKDGWQELVVEQPAGKLDAVELHVASVYEGSKYADLCISDVQVFATSTTRDNPAFEKTKREKLLAWKSERVKAAKLFKDKSAMELPVMPAYRWKTDEKYDEGEPLWEKCQNDDMCWTEKTVALARKQDAALAAKHKDAYALVESAMKDASAFVPAQLAPTDNRELPTVDGLYQPDLWLASEKAWGHQGMETPILGTIAGLRADRLGAFEVKKSVDLDEIASGRAKSCRSRKDKVHTWMLKQKVGGRDAVRAVIFASCRIIEVRDGEQEEGTLQLAVYDAEGKLEVLAGPGYLDVYQWKGTMIAGGKGFFFDGRTGELSGPEVARNP